MRKQLISICTIGILVFSAKTAGNALVAEAAGKGDETYAATNEIQMENRVITQVNIPTEPLILTPEVGSFFYGELGGTYDDWGDDMWCSFEKTPNAPNFGFEDWHTPACSKWCHIGAFANQTTASSELNSASDRYCAANAVRKNREQPSTRD